MKYLYYDGFVGTIDFSQQDNLFFGTVLGVTDSISYQGENEDELSQDFINAIEDYKDLCEKLKKPIERVCRMISA